MYFFDVGSDISCSVQLFLNCHVTYGSAAIIIMVVAVLFLMIFPAFSAAYEDDDIRDTKRRYCLFSAGFFLNYLRLNLSDLIGNELSDGGTKVKFDGLHTKHKYQYGYEKSLVEVER